MRARISSSVSRALLGLTAVFCVLYSVAARGQSTQPGADAPPNSIHGLDVSAAPRTTDLRELADLIDLNARGTLRVRTNGVIALVLDDNSTVRYIPSLAQFYIEYRAGTRANVPVPGRVGAYTNRGPQGEPMYFGPFQIDPFEQFHISDLIVERMNSDMRGQDIRLISTQIDALSALLRSADRGAAFHGLQLIEQILAKADPNSTLDTSLMSMTSQLDEYADALKKMGLEEQLSSARKAATDAEARLNAMAIEIPIDQYVRAPDVKPAVPADIPAASWGTPLNGLRMAAVPEKNSFALGQPVKVQIVLENAGDHDVKFSARSNVAMDLAAEITGPTQTNPLYARAPFFTGISPTVHYWLKPGERMVLCEAKLTYLASRPAQPNADFGNATVIAPAGQYDVLYRFLGYGGAWSRSIDGKMHRSSPARDEWHGQLKSKVSVTVTESR